MQTTDELNEWHRATDPWDYESSSDDRVRKATLLSELPRREYGRVLDIGCGQGFVTRDLPGASVLGIDVSEQAIRHAKHFEDGRIAFKTASLFELNNGVVLPGFDLIVLTGVMYPQYIGSGRHLVYQIIDDLLVSGGILVSVHVDEWYDARFPYLMLNELFYPYREFTHRLEIYVK